MCIIIIVLTINSTSSFSVSMTSYRLALHSSCSRAHDHRCPIPVSRRIMDLHGGRISVSSEGLGRGSTFTLDIVTAAHGSPPPGEEHVAFGSISARTPPEQRSSAQITPLEILVPSPTLHRHRSDVRLSFASPRMSDIRLSIVTQRTPSIVQLTALIVDDSALNRKMLCRSLKDHFEVVGDVESGQAAVDFIADQIARGEVLVDAIIMDYMMPGMDGPTAARAIRGMGYDRVIVGVTGNVGAEDISHFITCGANAVVMKPVDPDALAQRIVGEITEGKYFSNICL